MRGKLTRSWSAALVIVAVVGALALAAAPAGQATFGGRNGDLLWTLNAAGGPEQLWLTGPAGQRPHRILVGPASNLIGAAALFTRSGKQVVFQTLANSFVNYTVYLIDTDGTRARALADFSSLPAPKVLNQLPGSIALSPDGRTLAYGYNRSSSQGVESHKVVFIDLNTGTRMTITLAGALTGPDWLSTRTLVFLRADGTVDMTRADGSHPHRIDIRLRGAPSITIQGVKPSPDGRRLLLTGGPSSCGYPSLPACTTDLYLVPTTGGKAKRLTQSGAASAPVWSPDGSQIAFHDGRLNKLLTLTTGHLRTLHERIPPGGLGIVDWQGLP